MRSLTKYIFTCCLSFSFIIFEGKAQNNIGQISGRVFDINWHKPIDAVTVFTSSGHYAFTDSLGNYKILAKDNDSIWFSFLGKKTLKFPVDTIKNPFQFDIYLHLRIDILPEVKVRNRSYREDSIENRLTYKKYFEFRKPTLQLSSNTTPINVVTGGVSSGLSLTALIELFRFKKNRQMLSFQTRLVQQEQDRYIDKRFNKAILSKITYLKGNELDSFRNIYRPPYTFLQIINDLELAYYIQISYQAFLKKEPLNFELFKNPYDY